MGVPPDTRLGSSLLGYRLDGVVGRGGGGVVFRAFDTRLRRVVAVKLLASEIAADEAARERFLRETELAASLEHPNIIPIHDAGEVDSELYLVMRLVEGDLRAVLRAEGRLEPPRVVELLGQVSDALRIDPDTFEVVATIPVGENPGGIAVGEGSVWVIAHSS